MCHRSKESLCTLLIYMLWFNFILGLNFIFFCFKLVIISWHTQKQKKIKSKPRIKLKLNIYIKSGLKAKLSLIYTYNLPQQNIKLSNAKQRWQRERQKKINRLRSNKKTTLHVQHSFFVNFFAVVLHDHNVKRSSYYTHLTKKKAYTLTDFGALLMCSCSLFFSLPLVFTLLASPCWPLAFLLFSPPI